MNDTSQKAFPHGEDKVRYKRILLVYVKRESGWVLCAPRMMWHANLGHIQRGDTFRL